jgi:hypothetical protein
VVFSELPSNILNYLPRVCYIFCLRLLDLWPWYSLEMSTVIMKSLIMHFVRCRVSLLLWFNYYQHFVLIRCHSGSVGRVTGCGPDGQGIWVQFWSEVRDSCLLHCVQTASSYPMRTSDFSLEADSSHPFIAKDKNGGAAPPLLHVRFHGVLLN